jgi:hypothetical protein
VIRMKYSGVTPDSLSDGRHVEPNSIVSVPVGKDGEYAPEDQAKIDAGLLLRVDEDAPSKAAKSAKGDAK